MLSHLGRGGGHEMTVSSRGKQTSMRNTEGNEAETEACAHHREVKRNFLKRLGNPKQTFRTRSLAFSGSKFNTDKAEFIYD